MDSSSAERRYLNSKTYKIETLWTIANPTPVVDVPIKWLAQYHKTRHWLDKHGHPISAFEVLNNPHRALNHMQKSKEADLAYPIILAKSNLDILDGLHRLNKSIQLGHMTIQAHLLSVHDLKGQLDR